MTRKQLQKNFIVLEVYVEACNELGWGHLRGLTPGASSSSIPVKIYQVFLSLEKKALILNQNQFYFRRKNTMLIEQQLACDKGKADKAKKRKNTIFSMVQVFFK